MIVGQLTVIIVPAAVAALGHPVCAGRAGARHAGRLAQLLDWHGIRHAVLVGPNSGYGEDNRCLAHLAALDMIAGVQVVDDQLVALAPLLERSGLRVHLTLWTPRSGGGDRCSRLPGAVAVGRVRPRGGEEVASPRPQGRIILTAAPGRPAVGPAAEWSASAHRGPNRAAPGAR
jgi:hypothetical protein